MSERLRRGGDLPLGMPDIARVINGASYSTREIDQRFYDVGFRFSPRDPFAVHLTHYTRQGEVTWIFDIDMLDKGRTEEIGEGDVRVSLNDVDLRPEVRVDYFSNLGVFTSIYPRQEVDEFLAAVEAKYPPERRRELFQRYFDMGFMGLLPQGPED